MPDSKVEWTKPQLVVLMRGSPDERVLLHCKRISLFAAGQQQSQQFGCDGGDNKNCGNCQSRSGS